MLQGIEQIFDNITEMITGLKRTTYQEKFETFAGGEYGYYFEEMSAYMKETKNHEAAAEAVGIRLMHAAEKKCGNRRGTLDGRTRDRRTQSFSMVYYIFPSILKQGGDMETLAEGVLKVSRKTLRNKELRCADYDTIYYGFSDKILGFITRRK